MLDLAGREERYLSTNSGANYSQRADGPGLHRTSGPSVGSGYYTVSVCVSRGRPPACAAEHPDGLRASYITADARGRGTSQASDTQCTSFSVDSGGEQFATGSTGADCGLLLAS